MPPKRVKATDVSPPSPAKTKVKVKARNASPAAVKNKVKAKAKNDSPPPPAKPKVKSKISLSPPPTKSKVKDQYKNISPSKVKFTVNAAPPPVKPKVKAKNASPPPAKSNVKTKIFIAPPPPANSVVKVKPKTASLLPPKSKVKVKARNTSPPLPPKSKVKIITKTASSLPPPRSKSKVKRKSASPPPRKSNIKSKSKVKPKPVSPDSPPSPAKSKVKVKPKPVSPPSPAKSKIKVRPKSATPPPPPLAKVKVTEEIVQDRGDLPGEIEETRRKLNVVKHELAIINAKRAAAASGSGSLFPDGSLEETSALRNRLNKSNQVLKYMGEQTIKIMRAYIQGFVCKMPPEEVPSRTEIPRMLVPYLDQIGNCDHCLFSLSHLLKPKVYPGFKFSVDELLMAILVRVDRPLCEKLWYLTRSSGSPVLLKYDELFPDPNQVPFQRIKYLMKPSWNRKDVGTSMEEELKEEEEEMMDEEDEEFYEDEELAKEILTQKGKIMDKIGMEKAMDLQNNRNNNKEEMEDEDTEEMKELMHAQKEIEKEMLRVTKQNKKIMDKIWQKKGIKIDFQNNQTIYKMEIEPDNPMGIKKEIQNQKEKILDKIEKEKETDMDFQNNNKIKEVEIEEFWETEDNEMEELMNNQAKIDKEVLRVTKQSKKILERIGEETGIEDMAIMNYDIEMPHMEMDDDEEEEAIAKAEKRAARLERKRAKKERKEAKKAKTKAKKNALMAMVKKKTKGVKRKGFLKTREVMELAIEKEWKIQKEMERERKKEKRARKRVRKAEKRAAKEAEEERRRMNAEAEKDKKKILEAGKRARLEEAWALAREQERAEEEREEAIKQERARTLRIEMEKAKRAKMEREEMEIKMALEMEKAKEKAKMEMGMEKAKDMEKARELEKKERIAEPVELEKAKAKELEKVREMEKALEIKKKANELKWKMAKHQMDLEKAKELKKAKGLEKAKELEKSLELERKTKKLEKKLKEKAMKLENEGYKSREPPPITPTSESRDEGKFGLIHSQVPTPTIVNYAEIPPQKPAPNGIKSYLAKLSQKSAIAKSKSQLDKANNNLNNPKSNDQDSDSEDQPQPPSNPHPRIRVPLALVNPMTYDPLNDPLLNPEKVRALAAAGGPSIRMKQFHNLPSSIYPTSTATGGGLSNKTGLKPTKTSETGKRGKKVKPKARDYISENIAAACKTPIRLKGGGEEEGKAKETPPVTPTRAPVQKGGGPTIPWISWVPVVNKRGIKTMDGLYDFLDRVVDTSRTRHKSGKSRPKGRRGLVSNSPDPVGTTAKFPKANKAKSGKSRPKGRQGQGRRRSSSPPDGSAKLKAKSGKSVKLKIILKKGSQKKKRQVSNSSSSISTSTSSSY